MKKHSILIATSLAFLSISNFAAAQTSAPQALAIAEHHAMKDFTHLHGDTRAEVSEKLGAPMKEHAPVGEPAITRWDYDNMSVYFEGNMVLHVVVHDQS